MPGFTISSTVAAQSNKTSRPPTPHGNPPLFYKSKAALWHRAHKYGRRDLRLAALDLLFARFVSLPFDDMAANDYADIRHKLEVASQVIGPNDLRLRPSAGRTN
jgi:hypothetical protein